MRSSGTRLGDRLQRAALHQLVGREHELATLADQLSAGGAAVTFVHGIGGIGKTALLRAAMPRLAASARVLWLDGRTIEPTARGFLQALRDVLSSRAQPDVEALARELEHAASQTVLVVDEFDHLRLLDDWLRDSLLPALPERTRWIFAGRLSPRAAWLASPGWSEAVLTLHLQPLGEAASRALLASRGVPETSMPSLLALARGTPLILTLMTVRQGTETAGTGAHEEAVLCAWADRSVHALPSSMREALDAGCVVRRMTRRLLEGMLERSCDDELLSQLGELSFVESTADGLTIHETVRHALAVRLGTRDPDRHRQLRCAAWRTLDQMLEESLPAGPHAWRLTADVLFLVEHPVREAFFPSRDSTIALDRARPEDHRELAQLVERREPSWWGEVFEGWWSLARHAFRIARDSSGRMQGFCIIAAAQDLPEALTRADPLLGIWQADVDQGPGRGRGALFMRRMITQEQGKSAREVRSAMWLDVKRLYIERPAQWALYAGTRQPEAMLQVMKPFGFVGTSLTHEDESTLQLEFGASGLWTWLRMLAKMTDLGGQTQASPPAPSWQLESATRALRVEGREVSLSGLEYRTLEYLLRHAPHVVTRDELLDAVWQQRIAGSNVVDAVIRLLRKKLGPYATELETIRGHGYRLSRGPGGAPSGGGRATQLGPWGPSR